MEQCFRNLRLMDNRIKTKKEMKMNGAAVVVNTLHEAEDLMRLLIARNAYEDVTLAWDWNPTTHHSFTVTVWWEED